MPSKLSAAQVKKFGEVPIQENGPYGFIPVVGTHSSLARGTDQLQASLYAFVNVIGDATGIDAVARFGEDGVARNLDEAALNPPTIRDWDDVDSLAEFGTYFLEAIGEQLPQLGVDATALIAGGATGAGIAGVAARREALSQLQKAAIGKALKRKLGEGGYAEFLVRAANTKGVKVGGGIGVGLSNFSQNTGETQIGFDQRGIDAPGTVLIAGAAKAALDTLAPLQLLGMARKAGVSPKNLPDLLTRVAQQVGVTGSTEAVTEGVQTLIDQVATRIQDPTFDLTSIENLKEIREAMIKGGIVGGTLGGGLTAATEAASYRNARRKVFDDLQDEFDSVFQENPTTPQTPTSESQSTIDAQARLITNDSSSRDSVLVTPGSPEPSPGLLPEQMFRVPTSDGGYLLTTNQDKAASLENATPETEESVLGDILFNRPDGRGNSNGLVVAGFDQENNSVLEIATNFDTLENDVGEAKRQVPAGGSVRITTATEAVARRAALVEREQNLEGATPIAAEILNELDIEQQEVSPQEDADQDTVAEQMIIAMNDALERRIPDPVHRAETIRMLQEGTDDEEVSVALDGLRTNLQNDVRQALSFLDNNEFNAEELALENQTLTPDTRMIEGISALSDDEIATDEALASSNLVSGDIPTQVTGIKKRELEALNREKSEHAKGSPQFNRIQSEIYKIMYPVRDEKTFISDGIVSAMKTARSRTLLANKETTPKGEKRVIENTLFTATHKNGQEVTFSGPQLTSAGMSLLKTRGVAGEQSLDRYRLQGFLTMVGELKAAGFDIENGAIPTTLIIHSRRNHNRRSGPTENLRSFMKKEREFRRSRQYTADQRNMTDEQLDIAIISDPRGDVEEVTGLGEFDQAPAPRAIVRDENYPVEEGEADPGDPGFVEAGDDTRRSITARAGTDSVYADETFDAAGNSIAALDQERALNPEALESKPTATVVSDSNRALNIKHGDGTIRAVQGFGATITKKDVNFVRGVLNEIGLVNISMVVGDIDSLADLQAAGHLTAQERAKVEAKFQYNSTGAIFVPRGNSGTIVIRPSTTGRAGEQKRLAALGHEVGHAVFNSIHNKILDPQTDREKHLADRLRAAYEANRSQDAAYAASNGFEEWFSDKISARARGIITGEPKSFVEKFFATSAALLRKTYNAVKSKIAPRFHRNSRFEDVIDAYKYDNVFNNVRTVAGDGQIKEMSQEETPINKVLTDEELAAFTRNMKKLDPRRAPLLGALFDVDNQLRGMGLDDLANMIYQPTNATNSNAYWARTEVEFARWVGEIQQVFDRKEKQGVINRVFNELARELPDSELSRQALELRRIIQALHRYTQEVIPNIGTIERFFPRAYDINAISARSEEFLAILEANGFDSVEAAEVHNNLLQNRSINDANSFVPKHSFLHKHRELTDENLIRALVDAEFLNTDPHNALINYTRKTVRRVELERIFGGYKFLKGYTLEGTLNQMDAPNARAATEENQRILQAYLSEHNYDDADISVEKALEEAIAQGHVHMAGPDPMWRDPTVELDHMLNAAVEELGLTETQRAKAYNLIIHALDAVQPLDPDSVLYNLTGEMRAYESLRTLAFSGVASIPEVGAVFARNKGSLNIGEFARLVNDSIKDFGQARELAEAIGAVQRDVVDSLLTEMLFDSNRGQYRFFRRAMPALFKLNGNDAVVVFSRVVATAAGKQFLIINAKAVADNQEGTLAHDRAKRYLAELGVTDHEAILRWNDRSVEKGTHELYNRAGPFSGDAKIVQDAINQFVNESVIRPNAAERPTWARHPIGGLVFHLKTFSYSYSKNILGGLYREGKARYAEDESMAAMLPYYLAAIGVFIALGAVGDELRNRIKSLGAKGSWDASYRNPNQMIMKWIERAGFTSQPFIGAIPIPYVQDVGMRDVAFELGPSVSHFYDLFGDGNGIDSGEVLRSIPVVSQVNKVRSELQAAIR